jgi:hypothetical protein
LDAIFQEWMIRLEIYIYGNGEYVEWCLNWNVQFRVVTGRSWDPMLRRNALYHMAMAILKSQSCIWSKILAVLKKWQNSGEIVFNNRIVFSQLFVCQTDRPVWISDSSIFSENVELAGQISS